MDVGCGRTVVTEETSIGPVLDEPKAHISECRSDILDLDGSITAHRQKVPYDAWKIVL